METNEILKKLRNINRISQKQLADDLGIGQATVCQWEKGISKPTCDTIAALAQYYEVTADFILGLSDEGDRQLNKEQEAFLGLFDNLTSVQKELIIGIMMQMKDL